MVNDMSIVIQASLDNQASKGFNQLDNNILKTRANVAKLNDELKTLTRSLMPKRGETVAPMGEVTASALANIRQRIYLENKNLTTLLREKNLISKMSVAPDPFIRSPAMLGGEAIIKDQAKQQAYFDNYYKNVAGAVRLTDKLTGSIRNAGKVSQEMDKAASRPFAGWAMSIMFFGMAIQRAFSQIRSYGTKTFKEIYESVEGNVSQVTLLEGSFKYLGFSIGAALEPIIAWIIPIVDKIADWINQHEKLTGSIVVVGTVLGALFSVGGGAVLALNGFLDLGSKMGLITMEADKISGYNWAALGNVVQKGLGVIAISFAVGDAVESFKELKDGAWVSGFGDAVAAGLEGWGGLTYLKGGKGSFKKGTLLVTLGIATDKLFEGTLFTDLMKIAGAIMAIFTALGMQIADNLKGFLVDAFIGAVAAMPDTVLSAFGIDLGQITKKALGISTETIDFTTAFNDAYAIYISKAMEYDAAIKKVIDSADAAAKEIQDLANATNLAKNSDLLDVAMAKDLLSAVEISQLISYYMRSPVAEDSNNIAALQREANSRGMSININNMNVTANDAEALFETIRARANVASGVYN
jgi:hypothetical protein